MSANKDVRVVVIRGDGDTAFSAGADIADFETARSGAANARAYDDLVEDTCQLIEAIARPTLAVIIGPCMGAGASLAASCDLRIAADNAFFAVPAARLGLGYDPRGIKRFLRVFGASATCELIFTAERLPAQRAHQLGTVSALVVPMADIERIAAEWTSRIADNAPLTIGAAKSAIRAHLSEDDAQSRRRRTALRRGRCQRRLCRGPPRLHGKTNAALHRQLTPIIRERPQKEIDMDLKLNGKTALVTGGSEGIGKGIARALAQEGVDVVICARRKEPLEAAAAEIAKETKRKIVAITCDLSKDADCRNFIEQGHKALGRIDIMVNNAGSSPGGVIEHLSEADWEQSLQLKFMGYVRCLRYVLPIMVKQGGGRVVNLIGNDGVKPSYWEIAPGAANAAGQNLTMSLAGQYGKDNISFCAVNPGPVRTERWAGLVAAMARDMKLPHEEADKLAPSSIPLGRIAEVEEVANLVVMLASPLMHMVNGTQIEIDGGQEKSLMDRLRDRK